MKHAIDVAQGELGIHEATGHNDGIPAEKYMRGDELAWCAGFVLWCFDESDDPDIWDAGLGPDQGKESDYWKLRKVSTMKAYLDERGLGLGWGVRPQRNDIVFFGSRQGSDAGEGNHVGLVANVCLREDGTTKLTTIEGNYGNKVAWVVRDTSDVVGYARITG